MKLDPDCIRDILVEVENHSTTLRNIPSSIIIEYPLLKKYGVEKLLYHFNQLSLDGLLINFSYNAHGDFSVNDLSPDGHRFLANIRNDKKWTETKSLVKGLGGFSLSMLKNVAQAVITAYIKKELHI